MTTALEGGEGSVSRPGRSLPPGKTLYPLYRRLGGPQGRSGQVRKILLPPGFDPRISSSYPVAIPTTLPGPQESTRMLQKIKPMHVSLEMASSDRGFKHLTGKYSTPVSSCCQDRTPFACVAVHQGKEVRRSAKGHI
jgi:hypothetical protein